MTLNYNADRTIISECHHNDNKLMIQCVSIKTPVTALHWYHGYLLVGSGGVVRVLQYDDPYNFYKQVAQFQVLTSSTVRGLKSFWDRYNDPRAPMMKNADERQLILVYGGKDIALVSSREDVFTIFHNFKFSDWIHDVQPLKNNCLAVALAHNSVVLYNWSTSSVCKQVHCDNKCILYSATFTTDRRFTITSK